MNRPPCVHRGPFKNSSSDRKRFEEGRGAVQWDPSLSVCIFILFFVSFLNPLALIHFISLLLSLWSTQALVLSVSSSMKELKRVSSQLWLAMHCCTTSSWPGSSAACSMVLVSFLHCRKVWYL